MKLSVDYLSFLKGYMARLLTGSSKKILNSNLPSEKHVNSHLTFPGQAYDFSGPLAIGQVRIKSYLPEGTIFEPCHEINH